MRVLRHFNPTAPLRKIFLPKIKLQRPRVCILDIAQNGCEIQTTESFFFLLVWNYDGLSHRSGYADVPKPDPGAGAANRLPSQPVSKKKIT